MSKKYFTGDDGVGKNSGRLLKEELAENLCKLELLNREQALKMEELSRVQEELDQLNKLYPASRPKK